MFRKVTITAGAAALAAAAAVGATALAPAFAHADTSPAEAGQAPPCASADLLVDVDPRFVKGTGLNAQLITAINIGDQACTLHGTPGLALTDVVGNPIGHHPGANQDVGEVITLEPSQAANSEVVIEDPALAGCEGVPTEAFAVSSKDAGGTPVVQTSANSGEEPEVCADPAIETVQVGAWSTNWTTYP